jgi:hypothetical protein
MNKFMNVNFLDLVGPVASIIYVHDHTGTNQEPRPGVHGTEVHAQASRKLLTSKTLLSLAASQKARSKQLGIWYSALLQYL